MAPGRRARREVPYQTIRHGGNSAYYAISNDHVQMPPFESIREAESYYATELHELTHYASLRIMPRRSSFLRTGAKRQRCISA